MDIIRLGDPYSSAYTPDASVIEGYSSMIWTERYRDPGEFEMVTTRIEETMDLLPEMTLISHRDTDEVMMVESHLIETDDDDLETLRVKGRTVDSFLENRFVESKYGKKRKLRKNYVAAGAAQLLVWQAVDNASGKDVTREDDFSWNTKDVIPNVMVSDNVSDYGESRRWWVQEGLLYPQLMNILVRGDLGIRVLRPNGPYESSGITRVSVATALGTRGDITRDLISTTGTLRFDIYQGKDRSHTQSDRPVVGFNYIRDEIENGQYLFSIKDFKTACEIMSGKGGPDVYRNETQQAYTGFRRRVMGFDAGEPEEPDKPTYPGKNASNAEQTLYDTKLAEWQDKVEEITEEFLEDAEKDALRGLKKAPRVYVFSGDISPLADYTYKTHYDLGDTVTLYGKYGQTERMIVSEYVRTDDAEGDSGYPGLMMP